MKEHHYYHEIFIILILVKTLLQKLLLSHRSLVLHHPLGSIAVVWLSNVCRTWLVGSSYRLALPLVVQWKLRDRLGLHGIGLLT